MGRSGRVRRKWASSVQAIAAARRPPVKLARPVGEPLTGAAQGRRHSAPRPRPGGLADTAPGTAAGTRHGQRFSDPDTVACRCVREGVGVPWGRHVPGNALCQDTMPARLVRPWCRGRKPKGTGPRRRPVRIRSGAGPTVRRGAGRGRETNVRNGVITVVVRTFVLVRAVRGAAAFCAASAPSAQMPHQRPGGPGVRRSKAAPFRTVRADRCAAVFRAGIGAERSDTAPTVVRPGRAARTCGRACAGPGQRRSVPPRGPP